MTRFQRENATASLSVGGRPLPLTLATDISVSSIHVGENAIQNAPLVFVGFGVDEPTLGYDQFGGAD